MTKTGKSRKMNILKLSKSRENKKHFFSFIYRLLLTFTCVSILWFMPALSSFAIAANNGNLAQALYQTAPELNIKPLFNTNIPIHQGYLYSFQVQKQDLEKEVTSLLNDKAKALGVTSESNYRAQILSIDSIEWIILSFDGTKISVNKTFPNLIKTEGATNNIDSSTLSYVFKTPTDPMDDSMVVAAATFTWTALDAGGTAVFSQPVVSTAFGRYFFTVVDVEPPHNFKLFPAALLSTCGSTISQFNNIVKANGLAGKYDENPEYIELTIIDDNPFGTQTQSKIKHNLNNVDGFVMVETYKENYKPYDYNKPSKKLNDDPFELEPAIYETLDESKENGKFSFHKPIRISQIPGRQVQAFEISNKTNPDDNVGYVIRIPITGLEEALELNEKDSSKMPLHFASMSDFQPLDQNARADFKSRPEKALKITFAVCDSSGNWLLPDPAILNNGAVFNSLLSEIAAANTSLLGNFKYNTHSFFTRLYVFDDKRPNAAVIMTNTKANKTDIFTIPNSNLSKSPFSNDMPEWEFSYDGNSAAMKLFPADEQERFKTALTVEEDVRLLFKVIAYDNVNQCLTAKDSNYCHGISTPFTMGTQNIKDSLRYTTWKINDPAAAPEFLNETQSDGQKLFVFPEYIFRKPDPGKKQSVEFEVCDTSPFRSPPANINGVINYENPSNFNSRKIKLKLNIIPQTVSMTKMGGDEKTKTINPENKQ